jgi:hypothetical protein
MKLAIFPNETTISVLVPAPNCELSLEEICVKDVPTGVPYRIIDSNDLPADREFRNAWEADFTNPDGYGG